MKSHLVFALIVVLAAFGLAQAQGPGDSNDGLTQPAPGGNPVPPPQSVPAQVTGTLYFSEDGNANGLYTLDTNNGAATNIGISGVTSSTVGLSPGADANSLFGSKWSLLMDINADGSGSVDIGGVGTEGLAYDAATGTLYGAINGGFFTVNPADGSTIAFLAAPGLDIEGIAFGNGGVYGIEGFAGSNTNLHFYDPNTNTWSVIGDTGIDWNLCGLAYDPGLNVLYAKGSQDSLLYKIDPATGATQVIGDTGIGSGGGLAFIGDPDQVPDLGPWGAGALLVLLLVGVVSLVAINRVAAA